MKTSIRAEGCDARLVAGVVEAFDVQVDATAGALEEELTTTLRTLAESPDAGPPQAVRDAVRDLLRAAGYKPSGRGKPASEYLAGAAQKGAFPRISTLVDAANLCSLRSGLPISLLDRTRALEGTTGLVIRPGRSGERYVFNGAGQEIDVAGLLCVAREDGAPVGNAVKDSLATRTDAATRAVLAVVWGSTACAPHVDVAHVTSALAAALVAHCAARDVTTAFVRGA